MLAQLTLVHGFDEANSRDHV